MSSGELLKGPPVLLHFYRVRGHVLTHLRKDTTALSVISRLPQGTSGEPELLSFQVTGLRQVRSRELSAELDSAKGLPTISPIQLRENLTTEFAQHLSFHILAVAERLRSESDPVAFTAARYKQLIDWGETKPAKLIALFDGLSIRTVHHRLYLARQSNLLDSPGAGYRGQ